MGALGNWNDYAANDSQPLPLRHNARQLLPKSPTTNDNSPKVRLYDPVGKPSPHAAKLVKFSVVHIAPKVTSANSRSDHGQKSRQFFTTATAIVQRKGKVRLNLTVLPETKEWLKKHDADGNMSECLDKVVRRIVAGKLVKASGEKPS